MPEISRFFGIVVSIEYRDHEPPHFHAFHGEYQASVDIVSGVVHGSLPPKALRRVLKWRSLHIEALMENWRLARQHRPLNPIPPLE